MVNELADAVHLSPSTCIRRVHALEDAGIIRGYVALFVPTKVGKGFTGPSGFRVR
ncbi:Lrp/AsnC family transcriptional regulator [Corynebacterium aurimucosum]|uniref:Lrp/AsnC family transcriptional regulator n=1 Tax=Corynebacterium aurimucosum TaxID=169292 RepID=UPI0009BC482F|nr:Lrp/AsnC family transcriptional regulator [Corynebacterium aurimucosum]